MKKSLLTVTPLAIKKLKNIVQKEKTNGILFSIKSGGCNGFEYNFEGVNTFFNKKNMIVEDDLKNRNM